MILDKKGRASGQLTRNLEIYGDELAVATEFLQKLKRGGAARHTAAARKAQSINKEALLCPRR